MVMQALSLRGSRPPIVAGLVAAALAAALCTALVSVVAAVAPAVSLGVVYLLGVVAVSTCWGLAAGVATSLLSALAFDFFHLPPVGRLTLSDGREWVALAVFLVVAVATSTIGELARERAAEAERRRAEADLMAEIARVLLGERGVADALGPIARRLAQTFEAASAEIVLREAPGDRRRRAIALRAEGRRLGTLLVPTTLEPSAEARLRERVVPALEVVLAGALERERLLAEVVVTESLRHSDEVKTALLRAVSHDLRSPVTAMIAAGDAVREPTLTDAERDELGALVVEQGGRLAHLIDNLLDLSRLQAGATRPRPAECAVEDVIDAALTDCPAGAVSVSIDPGLGPVRADFVQVERAFANLLENALRYSGGEPVAVRARAAGGRAVVRVVDRGPGIPASEQPRIFEPFYRAPGRAGARHRGSGLGLAIARGFVETNGGEIAVESVPGQGTSFVVALPLARRAGAAAPAAEALPR
jgi:two-component system, OmpR family, sensor histidine kinase KdpD